MAFQLVCSMCQQEYDPASLVWRCACGGVLDVAPFPVNLSSDAIQKRSAGLWRYREALPFAPASTDWQLITMGEGYTPLLAAGLIAKMPHILAVQARNCSPLARAFQAGAEVAQPVVNEGTVAEGIAIAAPARSRQILAAVQETQGMIITVAEADIVEARSQLACNGLYVEPTAAAAYAGLLTYLKQPDDGSLLVNRDALQSGTQTAVVALTGSGLKAS